MYRDYGNNSNVEKFIVFSFVCAELNPSVKMYDILMRDYLKAEFGVVPEDIVEKWNRRCWNCEKVGQNGQSKGSNINIKYWNKNMPQQ